MNGEWVRMWKEVMTYRRYCLGIRPKEQIKTTKIIKADGAPAEIRIEYHQNTSLERYCYTNLLGGKYGAGYGLGLFQRALETS